MQTFTWWENLLLGVMALLVILMLQRSAKTAFARSREVKADWMAVLLPLTLVVAFVIFLIKMV